MFARIAVPDVRHRADARIPRNQWAAEALAKRSLAVPEDPAKIPLDPMYQAVI